MIKTLYFNKYFRNRIIYRGIVLSEDKALKNLVINDDNIVAQVQGSELYDVRIQLGGIDPKMTCTCPYAEKGKNCKHMVAVLVSAGYVDEGNDDLDEDDVEYFEEEFTSEFTYLEVSHLVNDLGKDELRETLTNIIFENQDYMWLLTKEKLDSNENLNKFRRDLEDYIDFHGFIDYSKTSDFYHYFSQKLYNMFNTIYEDNVIEMANKFIDISQLFDDIPIDDSGGIRNTLIEELSSYLYQIIEVEDVVANEIIQTWFYTLVDDENSLILPHVFNLISGSYIRENQIDKGIRVLTEKISEELQIEGPTYSVENLLFVLVNLMKLRNDTDSEILVFLSDYKVFSFTIDFIIKVYEKEGKFEELEEVLLEAIDNFEELSLPGLVKKYKDILYQQYKLYGNEFEYKEILKEQILFESRDLLYYLEYKESFTRDEWIAARQEIIDFFEETGFNLQVLTQIYEEEGLYDDLMSLLEKQKSVGYLVKYTSVFPESYSGRLIELLMIEVDNLSSKSGNASHYKNIVKLLKHIQNLPTGEEQVILKVNKYRDKYKKRPRFQKELDKLMI
jgi:hypothetical protein